MATHSRVLTGLDGQRYRFEPGNFCMELLVTGGPGPGVAYEILHAPQNLASWLLDSRLTEVAPLELQDLDITAEGLAHVRHFRDTMWAVGTAIAHGQAPEKSHLQVINEAVGPAPRPQIDVETGKRAWATPITATQIVGAAAREAVDIIDSPRLRQCAGDNCYLLFLDTSRPGKRRWCSMERCGNRHKVREHRSRHQIAINNP
jgi:predicted RNA-binding Zn ribbon-like protein